MNIFAKLIIPMLFYDICIRLVWSPEFSESLDRRGIHQLVTTCKTKRRRRWCSVAPPMAKLVFFLMSWNLEQRLSRFRISYLFLCDLFLFYGGRKENPSFLESGGFLPIMLGEGGSYFGKDDLFFPLRNCILDRTAAKRAFLFCQRRHGQLMDGLMLVMWRAGWQLRLVESSIGKVST